MTDHVDKDEGQHLCECFIDLMGEKQTVIWRGEPDLVPWTEIRVILEVHGEQSVYDIKPVRLALRTTPMREKERLVLRYGRDPVEAVYAGKSFNMEWYVPGWPVDPEKQTAKQKSAAPPKRVPIRKPDDDAADDARI